MFNFHSAYLNGVLDEGETIYMEQPPHHEIVDRTCYVVKLNKSLYGLKQAGRKWYNTLCHSLASIGFRKSMVDPAVFYAVIEQDIVVLFIHVNNSMITGSSLALNKNSCQELLNILKSLTWVQYRGYLASQLSVIEISELYPFPKVPILNLYFIASIWKTQRHLQYL